MIYEKRGKWCVRVAGELKKFNSEEEAKVAAGIVEKNAYSSMYEETKLEPVSSFMSKKMEDCEDCECNPCECE